MGGSSFGVGSDASLGLPSPTAAPAFTVFEGPAPGAGAGGEDALCPYTRFGVPSA